MVIGAATGLDADTAIGPELPLGTEPVRNL